MNEEPADTRDVIPAAPAAEPYNSAAVRNVQAVLNDVPEQIGRYRIRERIGGGGMGEVYAADQSSPIKRKVAVKIIKAGMDSKQVVARFEAERQALAMMDHPNIARVLDAGTTDTGRPYFVMELVRGVPITQFCDHNKLSTRHRIELLVPVCMAVQHAHQKGIIHRDIKPSNVLVTLHDGIPVPKVIDFGIAKATNQQLTENTVYTEFRAMIGTPAYMSPEQAEMSGLDIDTRSDIYSLGVLMYELITGSTPFDTKRLVKAGLAEIQKIIAEEEPPRPSQRLSTLGEALTTIASERAIEPGRLGKLVVGELDWIVMKALEKDRRRRYGSASDFAADLQRHLAGEPVVAAPPSAGYRISKFARRYRTVIAMSTLILGLLLAGVIVSGLLAIRAHNAERQVTLQLAATQNEERIAKLERDQANDARQHAAESEIKATESEHKATEQATSSDLLAKYINAQYMLSQERLGPAYDAITAAIGVKPHWEYGELLAEIVARSRRAWKPVAHFPVTIDASLKCAFVGSDGRLLAMITGNHLRVYDIAASQSLSERELQPKPDSVFAIGNREVGVSSLHGIQIFSLNNLSNNRSLEIGTGAIKKVAVDASGAYLAVLSSTGDTSIFDAATMKPLATHRFELVSPKPGLPGVPSLNFSPSGDRLLFCSGLWTRPEIIWDWRANTIISHDFGRAISADFLNDHTVISVSRWEMSLDAFAFYIADLQKLNQPGAYIRVESKAGDHPSYWRARDKDGAQKMFAASTSTDAIDLFSLDTGEVLSSTRFSSLMPTCPVQPAFLAFNAASGALAITGDKEVVVFQSAGNQNHQVVIGKFQPMDFWSLTCAGDFGFTAHLERENVKPSDLLLARQPFVEDKFDEFHCAWPTPAKGQNADVWGVAASADAKTVAVLWQEDTSGGNIDSDYFRKQILIYKLPATADPDQKIHPVKIIPLPKYDGVNGRNNRLLWMSPDGRQVGFVDASGNATLCNTADGSTINEVACGLNFFRSPDGSLFAGGDYTQDAPVRIWNTSNGSQIFTSADVGKVRTIAIAPDNKTIWIGWSPDQVRAYDIATGKVIVSFTSKLSPMAISPKGDRFLGFLADNNNPGAVTGSVALGSLPDGQTIMVLHEGSHILNQAFFSKSGDGVALSLSRYGAAFGCSLTVPQAETKLNELTPFAIKSTTQPDSATTEP